MRDPNLVHITLKTFSIVWEWHLGHHKISCMRLHSTLVRDGLELAVLPEPFSAGLVGIRLWPILQDFGTVRSSLLKILHTSLEEAGDRNILEFFQKYRGQSLIVPDTDTTSVCLSAVLLLEGTSAFNSYAMLFERAFRQIADCLGSNFDIYRMEGWRISPVAITNMMYFLLLMIEYRPELWNVDVQRSLYCARDFVCHIMTLDPSEIKYWCRYYRSKDESHCDTRLSRLVAYVATIVQRYPSEKFVEPLVAGIQRLLSFLPKPDTMEQCYDKWMILTAYQAIDNKFDLGLHLKNLPQNIEEDVLYCTGTTDIEFLSSPVPESYLTALKDISVTSFQSTLSMELPRDYPNEKGIHENTISEKECFDFSTNGWKICKRFHNGLLLLNEKSSKYNCKNFLASCKQLRNLLVYILSLNSLVKQQFWFPGENLVVAYSQISYILQEFPWAFCYPIYLALQNSISRLGREHFDSLPQIHENGLFSSLPQAHEIDLQLEDASFLPHMNYSLFAKIIPPNRF